MRIKNALQHWRLVAVAGVFVCGVTALGLWRVTAGQKTELSDKSRDSVARAVQEGLGNEVFFATDEKQIASSVESVDSFVRARSDLRMTQETKDRLMKMETDSLTGAAPGIRAEDLSAALADTLVERFSSMTDEEINYAAKTTQQVDDLLVLRKNGDHSATPEGFVATAKALRELSKEGDAATRAVLVTAIDGELNSRLELFRAATPDKFASEKDVAMSPLRALVLTYSIAADDDLTGSRDELNRAAVSGANKTRGKAFGRNGRIFASPIHLLFNQKTMAGLLDRLERGGQ